MTLNVPGCCPDVSLLSGAVTHRLNEDGIKPRAIQVSKNLQLQDRVGEEEAFDHCTTSLIGKSLLLLNHAKRGIYYTTIYYWISDFSKSPCTTHPSVILISQIQTVWI